MGMGLRPMGPMRRREIACDHPVERRLKWTTLVHFKNRFGAFLGDLCRRKGRWGKELWRWEWAKGKILEADMLDVVGPFLRA